ncbi:DUF1989 domain-containing protein [Klebsiella variicola]
MKGSAGESGALFIEIPEHIDLTGLPAFERISILLRENIISGNLVAGQALGEIELAALCDSSRNTLREALRFLHGEGLVNYHQNRGVFVRQLDKRDIRDIFKARRHLEVLALTVNTPISDFHLARMEKHLDNAAQSAAASEWRSVGTHSLRFHQSIVQMLGCERFNDFFSVLLAQLRLLFCSGAGERDFQLPWIARDRQIGFAWEVPAGHLFRITTPEGPQVGDLNIWNRRDPRERMWVSRTRQLQRAHLSTYDRLWSNLPFIRPIATITADSLADYGIDSDGGRVHDLMGTRCDPYVNKLLTGEDFDFHCHSNLVRAVQPWGLTEFDVHDVMNVFQCTGLNDNDQYFMKACPAKKGDYLEFFAEIDLLCALSTCPGGDLSLPMWGEEAQDTLRVCRPLGVEIYKPQADLVANWTPPVSPDYRGNHGMQLKPVAW